MSYSRKLALNAGDRALFVTTARLVSCLVTESLVRALYFPLDGFEATGIAVLLSPRSSVHVANLETGYALDDVLLVVPLQHVPIFKHDGADHGDPEIGLLDPMDMMPLAFEMDDASKGGSNMVEHHDLINAITAILSGLGMGLSNVTVTLCPSKGPVSLWQTYAMSTNIPESVIQEIREELECSVQWQTYSYEHPPPAPSFENPSITWEQSIVEGHPTHPMYKIRRFLHPIPDFKPGEYDLYHPKIRFVAVPRENLKITYDFERLSEPVRLAAARNAGQELVIPDGFVPIPVHELQIYHIQDKFPDAVVFPPAFHVDALAQQSIRSLIVPDAYEDLALKVAVGIKLTSAVRTLLPAATYLGPRLSTLVVPALTMDRNILTVTRELASVIHSHPNRDVAKYCAAIVREAHENTSEARNERLIVCTSLVESGHAGKDGNIASVIRIFNLDSEEKRIDWLDKFVKLFLDAFLPTVIHNGFAFECHPQNCVARFNLQTKELLGFVARDFGGVRVHLETLRATTGVDLDFLAGYPIIAEDLESVYTQMYHTLIHNHLQQLIRVLGLHYNGKGWQIVRKHLTNIIPREHGLYKLWMAPENRTVPGKCLLRMRIQGMYLFPVHKSFPNLIHYRGVPDDRK